MKSCLIQLFALLLLVFDLKGQSDLDSLQVLKSKESALNLYELAMEGSHHLYNGWEYSAYEPLDEEHPYFLTEEWTFSDLKYDGEWFRKVPLLFDINKNKLITSYYYNGSLMQLVQSQIDEFTMQGHRFINIKSSTDSTTLQPGFYEVLHDGYTPVLAKRLKGFVEKLEGTEVYRKFVETSQIFIVINGQYRRVRNKYDVIATLKSKKKEMKDYIRSQQLFTAEKENSIVLAVQHFDRINGK